MVKRHEHSWIYSHKSCCFVLSCATPGCISRTTVREMVDNQTPRRGEPVKILEDGYTGEIIGSSIVTLY